MPRTARLDIPDLLHHVMVRGVEGCDIFRDDADRQHFVRNFSRLLLETRTECLAWSLMTNHFHLLLRPHQSLASFMRRLLTSYALYFNLRHQRSGHLFQNRYKSIVCEEEAYLLELVRYIHLNPLRAGLVPDLNALDHYPWSGHAVLMGKVSLKGQSPEEVLSRFSGREKEARQHYRDFVADGIGQGNQEDLSTARKKLLESEGDDGLYDPRILGTGAFVEGLRQRQGPASEFPGRLPLSEIVTRVCRHFEVEPGELRLKTRSASQVAARNLICFWAVCHMSYSGAETGRYLNLSRSGVCVAVRRGEKMVQENKKLLTLFND
jgi:REP element-mobilizing transposase RayT